MAQGTQLNTGFIGKNFGQKITVPEFEIFSNPTIQVSEIKRRRFKKLRKYVLCA